METTYTRGPCKTKVDPVYTDPPQSDVPIVHHAAMIPLAALARRRSKKSLVSEICGPSEISGAPGSGRRECGCGRVRRAPGGSFFRKPFGNKNLTGVFFPKKNKPPAPRDFLHPWIPPEKTGVPVCRQSARDSRGVRVGRLRRPALPKPGRVAAGEFWGARGTGPSGTGSSRIPQQGLAP